MTPRYSRRLDTVSSTPDMAASMRSPLTYCSLGQFRYSFSYSLPRPTMAAYMRYTPIIRLKIESISLPNDYFLLILSTNIPYFKAYGNDLKYCSKMYWLNPWIF